MTLTRTEIAQWLDRHPRTAPDSVDLKPDKRASLSSQLVRAVWDGRFTIAVGTDVPSSAASAALADLVAWRLATARAPDGLTLLVAAGRAEVLDAARTLRDAVHDRVDIKVMVLGEDGDRANVDDQPRPEFSASTRARRWAGLLEKWRAVEPPHLARHLASLVGHPSVRLYPMLSHDPVAGEWSLRVDGLEAARVGASGGVIDVGRTSLVGRVSPPRRRWLEVRPEGAFAVNEHNVDEAASLLSKLIERFPTCEVGVLDHGQPEHALESAVLRALVPVTTSNRQLVPWLDDGLVSRGSQFPTLWTDTGKPRYLDALLRDGEVPWAIELKVLKSGGSGAYYRHGLAQAVLYRHFIRSAQPVHEWFQHAGTDATLCRAAIAFPKVPKVAEARVESLRRLGELFDVDVVELAL